MRFMLHLGLQAGRPLQFSLVSPGSRSPSFTVRRIVSATIEQSLN
jgi:hypothetical protein